MNTSLNLLKISITKMIAFELEVNRGTSFSDGEFGRQHEPNPKADRWFSADYRYGFIASEALAKCDRRT